MKLLNIILANLIYIFHIFIILFVLFSPFTQVPVYLILHIVFGLSLIIHWKNNSNVCSLSLLESSLRGIPYTHSFSHQFIGPVYDFSESEWASITYNITIILILISLYFLLTSPRWSIFNKCLNRMKNYIDQQTDMTFKNKLYHYINCLQVLFVWDI
jgi:hypothetical protein